MPLVATLVSTPTAPAVDQDLVRRAQEALGASETATVLSTGVAADIRFEGPNASAAMTLLREITGTAPVDIFVQPEEGRRKLLLIADMDSTMIRQECIDELAAELGLKERISDITERAMRGEIEFEPALRERVALLAGLPVSAIDTVLSNRIVLMPGGRTLVQTMKSNGAYCALVSGGFTHFTRAVAAMIGFDENQANTLLETDGRLAGKVSEPILGREAKRVRLEELVSQQKLSFEDTLAVGDGANDLAMIERAGSGVAYRAKPAVAEIADFRVDHGDLTALLYLQGYSESEFVLS
ncbi:phosphoserine phosphatase SerB [Roseibium album]|uniref:phosphoserine phosphatase SerB n=1 Tax=Roseibium album TaxID=311410 RepID=UPI000CF108CA|nr:phosphoserine phosphatase SerB [Roseibium album]MBG6144987.1 phosphoserine phosphatase [Labrenzia sp. EL_142]MBG6155697.1 phosphoserine phosphatase [Labrenzia sp. EL_162]MBG6161152.1 phosphoserine phosphatase [Labrenzia sp. EL_195]MBG6194231.1 phosphoserine phosphatase [Labrenzia sp. EL_159]MBG6203154.1 phosphoserine phosphatase [Labrenzia sp. EL_13]MCR9060702.1 phosphoserine phosphatase SerB [Paracoccaceae bacterium]